MQNNTFSGLFVGQNLVTLTEVDSTNNFLKQALANSTPLSEGTVIMAESQFAGRGQQNNKWHSDPGKNLTFSVLLKPVFLPIGNQFDLTVAISMGINNALKKHLPQGVSIKWPNDIYFNDSKLGGILIENMVQGSQIKHSVIGIGLNVNQPGFPPALPNAISMKQILHTDSHLKNLLFDICHGIEASYLTLRAGNFEALKALYVQNLYGFNRTRLFKAGAEVFNGEITGVERNGQLLVSFDGEQRLFSFKEIEFLNNK